MKTHDMRYPQQFVLMMGAEGDALPDILPMISYHQSVRLRESWAPPNQLTR